MNCPSWNFVCLFKGNRKDKWKNNEKTPWGKEFQKTKTCEAQTRATEESDSGADWRHPDRRTLGLLDISGMHPGSAPHLLVNTDPDFCLQVPVCELCVQAQARASSQCSGIQGSIFSNVGDSI